jgi:hypothetical protein
MPGYTFPRDEDDLAARYAAGLPTPFTTGRPRPTYRSSSAMNHSSHPWPTYGSSSGVNQSYPRTAPPSHTGSYTGSEAASYSSYSSAREDIVVSSHLLAFRRCLDALQVRNAYAQLQQNYQALQQRFGALQAENSKLQAYCRQVQAERAVSQPVRCAGLTDLR